MLQNSKVSKDLVVLNNAPRILFYVTRYWPAIAGASLHTRELVKKLSDDYAVGVLRHSGDDPVSKEIAFSRNPTLTLSDGITPIYQVGPSRKFRWVLQFLAQKYQSTRWLRPLYNTLLSLTIQRQIEHISQSYDIIHAVYTGMTASVRTAQKIAKRQGKPFILTPLIYIDHPHQKAARSLRRLYLQSDLLIAMTPFEKEWLVRQGVKRDRIHICPYGPLVCPHVKPEEFRKRYHLGDDPIILFVGRQVPEKGYHPLTLAAEKVWKKYPTAQFVFIGPTTTDSQAFFKEVVDPRILNLGEVSDVDKSSALAACDIFCLPSYKESLGVAYLEAWEFEKPVIAADIPIISSMIDHEQDGLVLQPVPTAIAAGIIRLLDNPSWRHELGCRGYRKVRANYDWYLITHQMHKIYASLYHLHLKK